MACFWTNTGAESGILRKNDQRDKLEDLLVFGYACKLFRDDEKAKEIDKGKHLIPWMGDNTLKIDRYDGRGTLSDLFPYEASKEGYDATRWLGLSESERKIEQLCDEERYFSLHTNEEEDELYKEKKFPSGKNKRAWMKDIMNVEEAEVVWKNRNQEAQKRSKTQTNQIQYNYEESPKTEGPTLPTEEDDEPFIPPPDLDLPIGIALPLTVKQNARIEKTALFISKEGPQMEILLKTKQSGNPQFGFLTQENELYRYYRHVLMAIKTGRYKMSSENNKTGNEDSKEGAHYLHPSLLPEVNTLHPVPQISYKPSADCAYSQLIQRIQGYQPAPEVPAVTNPPDNNTTNLQAVYQQHYIQHYQQYGYYPNYDQNHPYFAQFGQYGEYQAGSSNPYAQIVSNLKTKDDQGGQNGQNSQNGFESSNTEISKAPVLYGQKSETNQTLPEIKEANPVLIVVKTTPKPLLSLAEYSDSDSEESDDENDQNSNSNAIVIPPNDIQIIIDKMAAYVAKNGADFETIVKSKGDTRFIFLEDTHPFHLYYKYKLKECLDKNKRIEQKNEEKIDEKKEKEEEKEVKEETAKKDEEKEKKIVAKSKEKKVITPVSFSIKKPQTSSDSVNRDKSALPVEDSTDDEEQIQIDQSGVSSSGGGASAGGESQSDGTVQEKEEGEIKKEETKNIIEIEDSIMELIDLTEELEEKRDKRAEDRLKDKIAAAAREKLGEKNRALQMERKKRAAAFLSQLKPQSNSAHSKPEVEEVKTVRLATPESGGTPPESSDLSRMVYHIERSNTPQKESNHDRSRSSSTHKHKSSHKKHSHKRSHSHSHKRKREKRSKERKKSKKRHSSKSRSKSPHKSRAEKREHSSEADRKKSKKKREKSPENSPHSSDYASDSIHQK